LLKNGNGLLPGTFKLYQNAPNPFNPVTEIKFDLPKAGYVSLTVFNLLGQEVVRLIETDLPAGSHSITWTGRDDSGSGVSSGIYFYRLDGAGFSDKKKMILLK
jgi:flagellar hook assembly protein FlgD